MSHLPAPPNKYNRGRLALAKIGALAISKADERMLEPGEHLLSVVRRHPIGIFAIYALFLAGTISLLALTIVLTGGSLDQLLGWAAAGSVFFAAFMIGLLWVTLYVYRQSRLVVTDKSLMQVIQRALFSRKVSHLSMSNVEDVSVDQQGVLPTLLNYGTITVHTAGAVENFVFPLCPNPQKYASRIMDARQQYVRRYGTQD